MTQRQEVAVVTGGAAGIGAAVCRRMAVDGYAVAIVDRDGERAAQVADAIRASGGEAEAFVCDLSVPEQIDAAFDAIVGRFGRVDVLVNDAGVGGYLHWADMTIEEWHRFTSVNCDAAFLCVQRAAKEMVGRHVCGRIVVVLSQSAHNQDEDIVVPYGTSKWCERGLMEAAADALDPYGIAVNGVCPGTVWTPMMDGFCAEYLASGAGTKENYVAFIESKYPTGRLQEPEDIAAMASFLARPGCPLRGQSTLVAGGIVFS